MTRWITAFSAGVRSGEPYTVADVQALADNFHRWRGKLDPPCVLGHSEGQAWLKDTGLPAAGWVADARRVGNDLQLRFDRMPPAVARLVEVGAYDKLSVEIYHEPPEGIPAKGLLLRRVALLGGELPQVKTLGDLTRLWDAGPAKRRAGRRRALAYAERVELPGSGTWAVFFEVRKMADDAVQQVAEAAIKEKFPGLPDDFVSSLTPDQMGMLATSMTGAADDAAPADATPMAEWPEDVTRESAAADLVGAGYDQAELDAMDDVALLALWQKKMGPGGGTTPMSERPTPVLDRRFAEADRRLAALNRRAAALEAESGRREKAERSRAVAAFCERWEREGHVLPREVDRTAKTVNLYHRLMGADGVVVRKFGEQALTEFDSLVEEIEERGPGFARRMFGEKVAQPADANRFAALDADTDAYIDAKNKRRRAV